MGGHTLQSALVPLFVILYTSLIYPDLRYKLVAFSAITATEAQVFPVDFFLVASFVYLATAMCACDNVGQWGSILPY